MATISSNEMTSVNKLSDYLTIQMWHVNIFILVYINKELAMIMIN